MRAAVVRSHPRLIEFEPDPVRILDEGDDVLRPDLDRPRQGRARAQEAADLPLDVLALEGEVVQLAPLPVPRVRIPVEFEHVLRTFAPQGSDFPTSRLDCVAAEVLHPEGVAIEGDRSVQVLDLNPRVGVAHGDASPRDHRPRSLEGSPGGRPTATRLRSLRRYGAREWGKAMRYASPVVLLIVGFALIAVGVPTLAVAGSSSPTFDITTLAGKVASVRATDGLYLRVSAFLEDEADASDAVAAPSPSTPPISPTYVLSSPLDGASVAAPAVTVNVDTAGAPQNEPAIAVDPNNPMRIVVGSNDYASRTWTCTVGGTPCSALGDAYSGTYYSNDGGATWCCTSSDPSNLGTIIPGVERLTGGQYDAGGDPSLAFDSQGHVYFAGLGFDRTAPPNTIAVNKGTFDGSGALTWGPPTFIGQTTAPSILNDKEWIGVDTDAGSPFLDRVYVSWTRFIFNPHNGRYVQGPIMFAFSSDGGSTFSDPQLIVGNVLYDQGSRVVVGSDGTVYVFWEGSTRLATFNGIWMVKS